MQIEIKKYVDTLFKDAPDTPEASALKEEILSNLNDKYADLKASGASDKDAFNSVKAQVGDISALIAALPNPNNNQINNANHDEIIKKRALFSAVGVAFVIISPIFVLLCELLNAPVELGPILLIICVGIGIGLFVYRNSAYKQTEAYSGNKHINWQENQSEQANKSKSAQYVRLNWLLTVCMYFVFSFTTGAWNVSWIIFLIGAATAQLIKINVREE